MNNNNNNNNKKKKNSIFFQSQQECVPTGIGYYQVSTYHPTPLMSTIAIIILLLSNLGNSFCLLSYLKNANILTNINIEPIAELEPILGHVWINLTLTIISVFILCCHVSIYHGESGRPRLIEKFKWKENSRTIAHFERKINDKYTKSYSTLSSLFILPNYESPGLWDVMNDQLLSIYDMLSMHKGKQSLPMKQAIEYGFKDSTAYSSVKEQIQDFNSELEDLVAIWSSSYGFDHLQIKYTSKKDEEKLIRMAQTLGIDIIIDGYYSGVPLDDLLA